MYAERRPACGSYEPICEAGAAGDSTIPARLKLLLEQKEKLLAQQKQIEVTLERLNRKIAKYEEENGIQGANG